jgi:hypothetical protein
MYKPEWFKDLSDSVQTTLYTQDSLGNSTIDTLFIKFSDQTRKPIKLEGKLTPQIKNIDVYNTFQFTFNKPIQSFDQKLIKWQKDTTYAVSLDTINTRYSWNHTKTILTLKNTFDTTSYINHQRTLIKQIESNVNDSTEATPTTKQERGTGTKQPPRITRTINLDADKGTFISIENDTLDAIRQEFTFVQQKQTGKILLTLNTEQQSSRIQLINKQYQTIREFDQTKQLVINNLPPGDYGIRILIDTNQDGKWSYGNIQQNIEPEPIFVAPEFTSLRANWEITLDISF